MRNLVKVSVLALALGWAQHSIAAPTAGPTSGTDMRSVSLGGVSAMCGVKKSEAADEQAIADYAKDKDLKPIELAKSDVTKFVDAINASPPATTMKVDKLIIYRGEAYVFLFVINGGRFCAMHPMPVKIFDELADATFGAGS